MTVNQKIYNNWKEWICKPENMHIRYTFYNFIVWLSKREYNKRYFLTNKQYKITTIFIPNIFLTNFSSAEVAQLVERHLAKVEAAGSNPVFRSAVHFSTVTVRF